MAKDKGRTERLFGRRSSRRGDQFGKNSNSEKKRKHGFIVSIVSKRDIQKIPPPPPHQPVQAQQDAAARRAEELARQKQEAAQAAYDKTWDT